MVLDFLHCPSVFLYLLVVRGRGGKWLHCTRCVSSPDKDWEEEQGDSLIPPNWWVQSNRQYETLAFWGKVYMYVSFYLDGSPNKLALLSQFQSHLTEWERSQRPVPISLNIGNEEGFIKVLVEEKPAAVFITKKTTWEKKNLNSSATGSTSTGVCIFLNIFLK